MACYPPPLALLIQLSRTSYSTPSPQVGGALDAMTPMTPKSVSSASSDSTDLEDDPDVAVVSCTAAVWERAAGWESVLLWVCVCCPLRRDSRLPTDPEDDTYVSAMSSSPDSAPWLGSVLAERQQPGSTHSVHAAVLASPARLTTPLLLAHLGRPQVEGLLEPYFLQVCVCVWVPSWLAS